jgi:hypothetical protein
MTSTIKQRTTFDMRQYVKVIAILSLFRAGLASAQLPDEDNRLEYDPSKGEECMLGWYEGTPQYTQPWVMWDVSVGDWGSLTPVRVSRLPSDVTGKSLIGPILRCTREPPI